MQVWTDDDISESKACGSKTQTLIHCCFRKMLVKKKDLQNHLPVISVKNNNELLTMIVSVPKTLSYFHRNVIDLPTEGIYLRVLSSSVVTGITVY